MEQKTENQEKNNNNDDDIRGIVDIHGINFDITSVLKDVTKSIQNNLKKSFDDIFKDYELYKSTHDALLQIPFVKDLYNKNSELSLQVEILKKEEEQKGEEEEEHEPTITLNIHESSTSDNPVNQPSPLTDFLKTNKINKKQTENDSEAEEEEATNEEESEEEKEAEEEEEEEEEGAQDD